MVGEVSSAPGGRLNPEMVGGLRGGVGCDAGVREGEGCKELAVLRIWSVGLWRWRPSKTPILLGQGRWAGSVESGG